MTEFAPTPEQAPPELSDSAKKILLEAAQFYILSRPTEGTIQEIDYGMDPDDTFIKDVRTMWHQRNRDTDPTQFEADLAAIKQLLTSEEAAEAIIMEQRATREEARAHMRTAVSPAEVLAAPVLPAVDTVDAVATSGFSKLFRRRNNSHRL